MKDTENANAYAQDALTIRARACARVCDQNNIIL